MSDKPTFKVGNRVLAAWHGVYRPAIIERYRSQHDDYLIKFTDNLFSTNDLLSGSYSRCAGELRHIDTIQAPHADYPHGGAAGYAADMATLERVGAWAVAGEYEDGSLFHHRDIVVHALDVAAALKRMLPYLKGKGVL